MNATWHFLIMVLFSFLLFFIVIRIVIEKNEFAKRKTSIVVLAAVIVIAGMLFGKFGANWGFPWWIYYPVPMLMNVLLPPVVLKMNTSRTILYLILAILSAPFIHICFSFLLGWNEYMPFWNIPYLKDIF